MKRIFSTLTIALAFSVPAVVQAGRPTDMADAEVRKVDKDAAKVTLKHGEIKSLDMPPMTMVLTAKDKALLDKVKAGDKVKFQAANEGGKLVVTAIDVVQ